MKMHPEAANNFNEKANALPGQLTIRAARNQSARQGFVPDVHITANIPFQDIIGEIRMSRRDREGNEAGKAFHHNGETIELVGEAYQTLKKIAVGMQKSPELRDSVSIQLLIDLIFEWVKNSYLRTTGHAMTDYVLMESEKRIKTLEVWIPIASTHVQSEFQFGKMTIKTITRAMLDRWEAEFRQSHPDVPAGPDEFFLKWRKDVLGLAAATMEIKAEPIRAYELASNEAERTLDLLRCMSPQNCFPFVVSYSVPLGQEGPRSFQYLMTENDKVAFSTRGYERTPLDRWTIDDLYFREMKRFGLDALSTLQNLKKPTPFQREVIDALQLYGKSSTFRGSADKLTYILNALEALLLPNKMQSPQDLAERLAMLVDNTPTGRKGAYEMTLNIYDRRLVFVHGEHTASDMKLLEQFMSSSWAFFINCIAYANKYETKDEFIRTIDNVKLSGGLK